MFLEIKNIISPKILSTVNELISEATFIDGKATAGKAARKIKNNKVGVAKSDKNLMEANKILFKEVNQNRDFLQVCFPKKMAPLLFSRYDEGMYYGRHLDNAILTFDQHLRADLSMTIFLNDAKDYDGGDLIVDFGGETKTYTGNAGDMILYPSGLFHEVSKVTKGTRMVAVAWVESMIRNLEQRELLADLGRLSNQENPPKDQLKTTLTKAYYNLARLWAET